MRASSETDRQRTKTGLIDGEEGGAICKETVIRETFGDLWTFLGSPPDLSINSGRSGDPQIRFYRSTPDRLRNWVRANHYLRLKSVIVGYVLPQPTGTYVGAFYPDDGVRSFDWAKRELFPGRQLSANFTSSAISLVKRGGKFASRGA